MSGFRRLFAGEAVSSFGDWFTYVALSVLAVGQDHQALALAVVLIALGAPRALLAPFAGVLADRMDRRKLLVLATAGRGVAAAAMVVMAVMGWAWAVQACYLVRMALGALTDAATRAMLPRLVPPAQLARANALLGLAWNALFVLGVAAGGVTTAVAGVAIAFAVDALSFFVAAAMFTTLPQTSPSVSRPRAAAALPSGSERRAVFAKVPVSLATGAAWIVLNEAAGRGHDVAIGIGAVHVVRAIGAGLAPLVWPRQWRGTSRGVQISTAIALAGIALFSVVRAPLGALACAAIWGIGVGANWVTSTTLLQGTVPDARLGRAVAIDVAAQTLAQCAGGVIAAGVSTACSGAVAGWSGVGLALAAWLVIERRSR